MKLKIYINMKEKKTKERNVCWFVIFYAYLYEVV